MLKQVSQILLKTGKRILRMLFLPEKFHTKQLVVLKESLSSMLFRFQKLSKLQFRQAVMYEDR